MKTTLFILAGLVFVTLFCGRPCAASTDSALAYSTYFDAVRDFSDDDQDGDEHVRSWRDWIQYHRAVERSPALRRQILRLPGTPDERRSGAVAWMRRRIPAGFARSQPTHIYVLRFGVYREPASVASFVRREWSLAARRRVYSTTPKGFRVGFHSEATGLKSEPLFVLPGTMGKERVQHLCYGIYASAQDANQDARRFRGIWGYEPTILRQALTTRLARALLYDPVAGTRM